MQGRDFAIFILRTRILDLHPPRLYEFGFFVNLARSFFVLACVVPSYLHVRLCLQLRFVQSNDIFAASPPSLCFVSFSLLGVAVALPLIVSRDGAFVVII